MIFITYNYLKIKREKKNRNTRIISIIKPVYYTHNGMTTAFIKQNGNSDGFERDLFGTREDKSNLYSYLRFWILKQALYIEMMYS